jgi:hypothetical protein
LFVACAIRLVNGGDATEGAHPKSFIRFPPARGNLKGRRKAGWWGSKGTFQGEQRPAEIDPSQVNRWRLR